VTDAIRRESAREQTLYRVREVRERRALEARLSDDRAFSAYALGHLEPELLTWARYWTADGPGGQATVMHARALGSVVVTVGDPEGVSAILATHPGLRSAYLSTATPEQLPAISRTHFVTDTLQMMRMSVTSFEFQDVGGEVRRLRGADAPRINTLYATDGNPSRYTAETIERAVYYGAFEGERLVAVAGTHIVSPHQSLAVVGNVFTHPSHRGRGFATRVTGAVTRALLDGGCSQAVLTVDPKNTPAVAAYSRLGYRQGAPVVEARLQRRDTFGITPAWRRYLARRRGRSLGDGIELVAPPRD
jgi:RimJ/RimL family protein N-acetyltransferase